MRSQIALSFLMLLPSCAALMMGPTQTVSFTSEPAGARVNVEVPGEPVVDGTTPCVLEIPRSAHGSTLRVVHDGRDVYAGEMLPVGSLMSDHPGVGVAAIFDAVLILPGIIDLTMGHRFWDWPHAVHATLPEVGKGSSKVTFDRKVRARPSTDSRPSSSDGW
jgi:hypothetical protein